MTNLLQFLRANAAFLTAGALLAFVSSFGQTFFISIFAGEIMQAFDLSDGEWGSIYATGTLASAALLIWAGGLTDRFRVRGLGSVVMVGLAVACFAMALNPWATILSLCIFLLRFTGHGMMSHLAVTAMARWFVASRGKALAIASSGLSIGEALLPLLFVLALGLVDWRLLWVAAGLLTLALVLPIHRLLKQERTPQSIAASNEALGMQGRHWTRIELLQHPMFWLLLPWILGPSAFVTAMFFQQVHLAEVKGWSHVSLVALFPLYTVFGTLAMLVSGLAIDRFGTRPMVGIIHLPFVASFAVMASADSIAGAAISFGLLGISAGCGATVPAAFWAEFYGTRHIGGIKAVATALMVLGSAIGPVLSGRLIDLGVDFPAQMPGIAAYFLISSAIAGVAAWIWGKGLARPA